MKKHTQMLLTTLLVGGFTACNPLQTEEVIDPNYPSVGAVTNNATKAQLDGLSIGQVSIARDGIQTYLWVVGTLGKELFNFNGTESRWLTELNGLRPIDNSAFYNGATTAFGLPVRQANITLAAVNNTNSVTDREKNGYRGIANTFKGLAYLYMLNAQGSNGVRLNVEDPFKPSKPASYAESLTGIAKILDDGAAQLDQAGTAFPYTLPSGYAGFDTPAAFKRFNRAIALRVAIYQADWAKAATLLPQTFYSATGDLNAGPRHTFNATPPDRANPLLNTASSQIVGVQQVFDAAEANDKRVGKVRRLATPLTYTSGVTYSTPYLTNMYASANDPVPIIRNEELILIAAEIAAQQGNAAEATRHLNIVRTAAGLPAYAGATTRDALINAILKERLYSLFYEGHRWVDMRRYNKLGEIVLPVAGMKVLERLERPVAEVNWDVFNP
ncbi:RagB/SusD family nutrient uptake outer membrane protein [Rudanella paleaurantiibacter]|uniref:RagB/SusD family nutrient uptake outer membrane protein n=1 Tax=Rudanella paleaurantiibacter TaxID=2614655 RepID=A0A7J5U367_9BACT|nr:RagB/SusD family nutrient uptake outer membrane protein [Rudanella paleaurantiibacter]KAB7732140.1 RagB/SusD family nutrient uptake outer membrane protein [Rudanella paleaurantiibacter]